MYYSAIGLLAIFVLFIVNWDILQSSKGSLISLHGMFTGGFCLLF